MADFIFTKSVDYRGKRFGNYQVGHGIRNFPKSFFFIFCSPYIIFALQCRGQSVYPIVVIHNHQHNRFVCFSVFPRACTSEGNRIVLEMRRQRGCSMLFPFGSKTMSYGKSNGENGSFMRCAFHFNPPIQLLNQLFGEKQFDIIYLIFNFFRLFGQDALNRYIKSFRNTFARICYGNYTFSVRSSLAIENTILSYALHRLKALLNSVLTTIRI